MSSHRQPYPPPPPPSLPPPVPPPPPSHQQSHYPQFNQYPPPPPPSLPPPTIPPPPPSHQPSHYPQFNQHQSKHHHNNKHHPRGNPSKTETEEERRLRKKKEIEKQKQKSQIQHTSTVGSKPPTTPTPTPLVENRLKKPTTFICKFKFRNELPDPTAQLKLLKVKPNLDQYTVITSLEKLWKPNIVVEPDLGIPLDLLDLSVYNNPNPGQVPILAPEDELLLLDDDVTPIKKDGVIKRKERPTDKGVSWLVKTQYISSLNNESARQSLTEKQAKELRDAKRLSGGDGNNSVLQDIVASFESCKTRPVHATNKSLKPVEVLPLLPYFDRYDEQFVLAKFDSAPTADSELFGKLKASERDEYESRAVLKSYVVDGKDPDKPDKFLAYMVPSLEMLDEQDDISYSWVREYLWDVPPTGKDGDSYFVSFDDGTARYLPLPTRLNLTKKRAREGKSSDETEQFPVPSGVTVRRKLAESETEYKDSEDY